MKWKIALLLLAASLSGMAAAEEFKIDPTHSFVQFKISHLGYSTLVGRFNTLSGRISRDADKIEGSKAEIVIDVTSIDTNHARRDQHLRSDDFLETEKWPEARFVSARVSGDAARLTLEGELTLHGKSAPVVIVAERIGEGEDPWGGYRVGYQGTTQLRLRDFGISERLGPAAAEVALELFIEGVRAD